METAHTILEKKGHLEEELQRVERQIYELEGEYLQACRHSQPCPATLASLPHVQPGALRFDRKLSRMGIFSEVGMGIWESKLPAEPFAG